MNFGMDKVFGVLWEAARQAGPFASLMLLTLWWIERRERIELQRAHGALYERILTAMNEAKEALRGLRDIMRGSTRDD